MLKAIWNSIKAKAARPLSHFSSACPIIGSPKRRGREWLQMFEKHPWLHAGITRTAEGVSSYFPKLYDLSGKEEQRILSHPLSTC